MRLIEYLEKTNYIHCTDSDRLSAISILMAYSKKFDIQQNPFHWKPLQSCANTFKRAKKYDIFHNDVTPFKLASKDSHLQKHKTFIDEENDTTALLSSWKSKIDAK